MSSYKNYYFILGVSKNASRDEIISAYRNSVAAASQDEFRSAMLGEFTEAYECLADPDRRREYDVSLGETASPSQPSNIYQRVSSEAAIAAETEFYKLQKKHRSKKKMAKNICFSLIFIIFAAVGALKGTEYFSKDKPLAAITEDLSSKMVIVTPKPDPKPELKQEKPVIKNVNPKPVIRTYGIQSGGVVTKDRAKCRALPEDNSRETATMAKDAVVFTSKEARYSDGSVWYYVSNSQFEGWARDGDVHVYNH
jgi:curved DNA-binding protein CbpA